jgi:HD-GYP domain-containing protein (c-di-GMP phosphodiesterase class II)
LPWLPLDPSRLRIGLYIKIDHSWLEHPFVRTTFTISSPSEIAIIRKHRLTRVFYDPDRSHADAVAALASPVQDQPEETDLDLQEAVEEDEKAMVKEKAIHVQRVVDHREQLEEAERNYVGTAKQCSTMLALIDAGKSEGLASATQLAAGMVEFLNQDKSVMLSLVQPKGFSDPDDEMVAHVMNTSALSVLTGKFMNLSGPQQQWLLLGGLFYNIGLRRIPLSTSVDGADVSEEEAKLRRMYPRVGKEMLEDLSNVDPEVIAIVHQHREYLDGTGYPQQLVNGAIGQLARLVGTVVEYNGLTWKGHSARSLGPAQALAHLYVRMKDKLGADVVEPFIATMTVYPPGSFVELSDGSIGLVVSTNAHDRLRPVVMLYDSSALDSVPAVVDLARERAFTIRKVLDPKAVPRDAVEALNPGKVVGYSLTAT